MSNKVIWSIVIAAALAAGFGFLGKQMEWFGQEDKPEVEVAEVKRIDITEKVSASGKVKPEIEVKISADVSGEITELAVKEGDSVQKGALLVKIRPDNYISLLERAKASVNTSKAALAQSKATLAQSKARFVRVRLDHERNRKLYDQKVISEADWENSKANFEVGQSELEAANSSVESAVYGIQNAEAALKDAAENLRKTTIYAPMSGIVSRLNVEQGERVVGTMQMTGTEILRIANLRKMEVEVEVNENDIVRIQMGDSAEVEVDSYAYLKRKFRGVVTSIANSAVETATAETVTEFKVDVKLLPGSYQDLIDKNPNSHPFRPGMTASLDILTDHKSQVLSVPLSAVASRSLKKQDRSGEKKVKEEMTDAEKRREEAANQKRDIVFVYSAGKVEMRPVRTGIADFESIEILEGLKAGEKIVTGPFIAITKTLESGDEVRLKDSKKKKNQDFTFQM